MLEYKYDTQLLIEGNDLDEDRISDYFTENCKRIIKNREWTKEKLSSLGFTLTDSRANFIFAKSDGIDGKALYLALKEKGVLVRHFDAPRISQYNRITIGNEEEMQILVDKIKEILKK